MGHKPGGGPAALIKITNAIVKKAGPVISRLLRGNLARNEKLRIREEGGARQNAAEKFNYLTAHNSVMAIVRGRNLAVYYFRRGPVKRNIV